MIALATLVQDPRVDLSGWSFHGIGSMGGNTLELKPGLPFELVPKTSLQEYIRMMPSYDVGLSLMLTPHPSLVPIEMASAGMWTVTNTLANKTAERLQAISTNLIGVEPTVGAIVDGLVQAMARVYEIDERLAGAQVEWPTDWDHAFPPETIGRIRAFLGNPMSDPVYDAAFFEGQAARSLVSARVVLSRVFPLLHPRRLLDVGCGVGTWLRAALELGADDVVGTDGDYVDPESLLIDRDRFIPADLATEAIPQVLGKPGGPAIRPGHVHGSRRTPAARRAPSLVAELASLSDVVLFSAAVPFQVRHEPRERAVAGILVDPVPRPGI